MKLWQHLRDYLESFYRDSFSTGRMQVVPQADGTGPDAWYEFVFAPDVSQKIRSDVQSYADMFVRAFRKGYTAARSESRYGLDPFGTETCIDWKATAEARKAALADDAFRTPTENDGVCDRKELKALTERIELTLNRYGVARALRLAGLIPEGYDLEDLEFPDDQDSECPCLDSLVKFTLKRETSE